MIIVNVSGGKDSTACLLLAMQQYDPDYILPIFADIGFEHTETYKYLDYLERILSIKIIRIKSEKYTGVIDCILKKHIFPGGMRRFCTHQLKLIPIWKYILKNNLSESEQWLGVRTQESNQRAIKYNKILAETPVDMVTMNIKCPAKLRKMKVKFPIIHWTEKQVFSFLKKGMVDHNPLYDRGSRRVGCYPCVISSLRDWKTCWRDIEGRRNIEMLFSAETVLNSKGYASTIKSDMDRHKIRRILEFDDSQEKLWIEEPQCGLCQI